MRRVASALAATLGAACIPNLGPSDSSINSARVLAVQAVPAEADPGTPVTFTSLVATPSGVADGAPIAWSFCTAPRPLTDDNVVSEACLGGASLVPAGQGAEVTATTPTDGCAVFGPDVPPGGYRPPDPDATGGYYQPLRAALTGADTTFALARIHCDLANAGSAAATAFAAAYTMNENPALLPLEAASSGSPASLARVPAGAYVTVTASWPAASAETFAYFDPATQEVTTQREAMQVAWYATGGGFDVESTGRASTDLSTTSDDGWTAPPAAGTVTLFVVLRDSRGGVAFTTQGVTVTAPP